MGCALEHLESSGTEVFFTNASIARKLHDCNKKRNIYP